MAAPAAPSSPSPTHDDHRQAGRYVLRFHTKRVEADYEGYMDSWMRDTYHANHDLWGMYVLDEIDDDKYHDEEFKVNQCKSESPYLHDWEKRELYCEELIAATEFARVTTFLCLLLTVIAAGGLCRYWRSPDAAAKPKNFERFSIILAVGGFIGLVGAANYSSKLSTVFEDLDTDDEGTNTCAAGCALSLSFGLIAMVAGAAAVVVAGVRVARHARGARVEVRRLRLRARRRVGDVAEGLAVIVRGPHLAAAARRDVDGAGLAALLLRGARAVRP